MKLVLMMAFIITLVGCGGKQSAVSLKVTGTMALSNTSFPGGLVVQGRGPNGRSFSRFLTNVDQINLELPTGTWTFDTIGFVGEKLFEGPTKCGMTGPLELRGSSSQVEISVDATTCSNEFFASSANSAYGSFKNLSLVTCRQFNLGTPGSPVVSSADQRLFCTSPSTLTSSAKKWAKSARIVPLVKDLGSDWKTGPVSSCLDIGVDGLVSRANSLNIATRSLPLQIDLFEDGACEDESLIVSYPFPKGLEHDYMTEDQFKLKQDKILVSDAASTYLVLSTSELKRGRVFFSELMPSIRCKTADGSAYAPCTPNPEIPIGADWVGSIDTSYALGRASNELNCSKLSLHNDSTQSSSPSDLAYEDCRVEQDIIKVRLKLSPTTLCTTTCNFKYRINGILQPKRVVEIQNSHLPQLFENLFRTVGHGGTAISPLDTSIIGDPAHSLPSFADKELDFGKLGRVREMFLPDGPAGVLGNIACTEDVRKVVPLNFYEGDQLKIYEVSLIGKDHYPEENIPNFYCDDMNLIPSTCLETYQAKMIVKKFENGTWVTESVMKLHCDKKIGMLESHEQKDGRDSRELIFWNTNFDDTARFETYTLDIERTTTPTVVERYRTEFERVERKNNKDVIVTSSKFSSDLQGTEYQQQAHTSLTNVNSVILSGVSRKVSARSSGPLEGTRAINPAFSLFEDSVFSVLENNPSLTKTYAIGVNPGSNVLESGTKMVKAYNRPGVQSSLINGKVMLEFHHYNSIPSAVSFPTGSLAPIKTIKASINNSGSALVCWIDFDDKAYHKFFISGTNQWTQMEGAISQSATSISDIDCHIKEDNTFFIAYTSNVTSFQSRIEIISRAADGLVNSSSLTTQGRPLKFSTALAYDGLHIAWVDSSVDDSNWAINYRKFRMGSYDFSMDERAELGAKSLFSVIDFGLDRIEQSEPTIYIKKSFSLTLPQELQIYNVTNLSLIIKTAIGDPFQFNQLPSIDCFAATNPLPLTAPQFNDCQINEGSTGFPVKILGRFDLKKLHPSNFKNYFTSPSNFE
ncbi:MAG TPA: hypothetical protein VNJ01_15240 [Bacteriovoracaceae bacterium]|nr:hypothetical protein [Bacteriovoracaceae bacterium]